MTRLLRTTSALAAGLLACVTLLTPPTATADTGTRKQWSSEQPASDAAGNLLSPRPASSALVGSGCPNTGTQPSRASVAKLMGDVAFAQGVPPQLLKVIGYKESTWRQFDSNGHTVVSADGGIGMMQLTGATAAQFDVCRLYTDVKYNITSGAVVLKQKMSKASEGVPSTVDKTLIENWYLAARYYNGGGSAANTYVADVVAKLRTPPSLIASYTSPIAITAPRTVWGSYTEPTRLRATADKAWTFYSSALTGSVVARGTGSVHYWREGPYNMRNVTTGLCVDLPGAGPGTLDGIVAQYTCNYTAKDQQFYLGRVGSYTGTQGTYPVYELRNLSDGLCLDVPGTGDNDATTLVTEYTCKGPTDNQYWYTVPRAGGAWVVNLKSKLCLDVAGSHAGNDARLTLYHCSDTDDHRWTFVKS